MALQSKRIVERFDIALAEIVRLAQQGYALKPLSAKMVGIVMYATMEINDDQIRTGEVAKVEETKVEDESQAEQVTFSETAPVAAKVTTAGRAKQTKAKMLNALTVRGVLHHLLLAKTSNVIICKAVDIDFFVSELLLSNSDLIYDKNQRMIRNRSNNARLRFFTKIGVGAAFKGLSPENVFIVEDADEKLVVQAQAEFKNVFHFSPIVEF